MFLDDQYAPNNGGTDNSQNRGADHIRQIMRADIHPGKPDQDRDWKTCKADASPREQ